jgi:hypothetical protein
MRRAQILYVGSTILFVLAVLLVWRAQVMLHARSAPPLLIMRTPHVAKRAPKTPAGSRWSAASSGAQKPLTAVVVADRLPPTTAGPALAICDPVASNASSDTAAFGAGCTRWLQYAMFNYPQLGQMMRWSEQERVLSESGISNLRLSAHQAQQLGHIIGYTHVAASTITGSPARCTLTLQVYTVSSNAATGQTCRATGSEAQIIAALPQLAQQLLTRIAVQTSAPPAPTLTADDLHAIGSYDWWPTAHPSPELQQQMQTLKQRDALAGMLYMLHNSGREEDYRRLFAQAPTNLEARAECLHIFDFFTPAMKAEIVKDLPALPNNFFVAESRLGNSRTPQELVRFAEHLVQCAPRNPAAWVILAAMYSRVSEHLRVARTAARISPDEWKALERLYAHQLSAVQTAVTLDPLYGKAWTEIAISGAFAGKPSVADTALWKAIQLDKGDARPYLWGLEMYQPKWFEDAAKLDKVAKLAVADTSLQSPGRYQLAAALQKLGRVTEAQQLEAQAKSGR